MKESSERIPNCGANRQTANRNSDPGFLWAEGRAKRGTERTSPILCSLRLLFHICPEP